MELRGLTNIKNDLINSNIFDKEIANDITFDIINTFHDFIWAYVKAEMKNNTKVIRLWNFGSFKLNKLKRAKKDLKHLIDDPYITRQDLRKAIFDKVDELEELGEFKNISTHLKDTLKSDKQSRTYANKAIIYADVKTIIKNAR